MKTKKVVITPKSNLGINRELPICYNCVFRHKDTGYCPMYDEYYDYNHRCETRKVFRYDFDLPYKNMHI